MVVPVITPLGHVITWPLPLLLSVYPVVHVCVHAESSVTKPSHEVSIPVPLGIFEHTSA